MKIFAKLILFSAKLYDFTMMHLFKSLLAECGRNVRFFPTKSMINYGTIYVGNDVFIGPGACFSASESKIIIGNKVMFGPNVTIMGGDHNTSVIGAYMYDIEEKLLENDLPVQIEDDVWIGTGVIILKGVTIRRGTIVAAGALVIKDTEEYSIVGGVPARLLKMRFDDESIKVHVEKLSFK